MASVISSVPDLRASSMASSNSFVSGIGSPAKDVGVSVGVRGASGVGYAGVSAPPVSPPCSSSPMGVRVDIVPA